MVSEMMKEKRHQSRAFMLLPMTGNIGQIIGPMLGMTFANLKLTGLTITGGFLADPISQYPGIFGKNTFLGGATGVQWMIDYPYALPNLVSACFLMSSACVIIFGLEEVRYFEVFRSNLTNIRHTLYSETDPTGALPSASTCNAGFCPASCNLQLQRSNMLPFQQTIHHTILSLPPLLM
jgi:hypothetical protein